MGFIRLEQVTFGFQNTTLLVCIKEQTNTEDSDLDSVLQNLQTLGGKSLLDSYYGYVYSSFDSSITIVMGSWTLIM